MRNQLPELGTWISGAGLGTFEANAVLSNMTSWDIGGPAEGLCTPFTRQACESILERAAATGVPVTVLGHGTNVLISDRGVRGLVLCTRRLSDIRMEGTRVYADAGVSLPNLAVAAAEAGLTGLEFAAGIPGTVGGAVAANAGAHGREIKDALEFVTLWSNRERRVCFAQELDLRYRRSRLRESREVVLEACFKLEKGDPGESLAKIRQWGRERREKQPLQYPNGGSVFRNPAEHSAGWYIERAGLKGASAGRAQISVKHANFIVNLGGAKAADVLDLIKQAQQTVLTKYGEHLETEVVLLGFDD
ncbi:MAG: UDP-N-acetylmuramate dehydrogenase [Peptococcaceae bacterium]|jgi:UDP-N-acetylmuramate dehydrogenase|nr:UDP-N-acetylmuramate dehydrogenase [Peptococcaceae bacterium]